MLMGLLRLREWRGLESSGEHIGRRLSLLPLMAWRLMDPRFKVLFAALGTDPGRHSITGHVIAFSVQG